MDAISSSKDTTNVVVLIALPEEHDRFLTQFPHIGDCNTDRLVRLRHETGISDFTLTSVLAENMGSDNAASAAYAAISDLDPDLVVCLGIAGALSSDVALGDVCVAVSKPQKISLGNAVLGVGERFLHYWTLKHSRIDFTKMRTDLLSDESVKNIADQLELYEDDFDNVRNALTLFIDDQEVKTLGTPLATIAHRLSSYAGVRSLKPIVQEITPNSSSAALLRASWMMDVDPANGRKFIKSALRDFTDHNLVRFILSSHLIWRIFWHHWQSSARFQFADVSKMILKPMGILATKSFDGKVRDAATRERPS